MDELDLTYTGSLAPLVNEVSGGNAASAFNNANILSSPVANQAGATALTGTSILTRVRSQRIQLGNVAPTTGSFTMALWFKRDGAAVSGHDSGGDQEHILSANQGQVGRWNLATGPFVNDNNFSIGWFHNGGFSPSLASGLKSGVWYHFAVTREMPSGTIRFYLNGQVTASGIDTASFTNGAAGTYLGVDPGLFSAGNRTFVGNFDDLRILNGAISQAGVIGLVGDSDADGLPDAWELSNFILSGEDPGFDAATILARFSGASDPDGDTLDNLGEFNALTNPNLADTDNDGLTDKVENNSGSWTSPSLTGTNPLKPDSDGDGLLDGQENNTGTYVSPADTGTNPNLADSDADTFNDYLEIARSTNPVRSNSTPGASSAGPLIDLSAAALTEGPLTSWSNTGTIARAFEADSLPNVETIGGVKGVSFNGGEVMTGPVAPSNLTGSSPRTIQAWIYNPTPSTEETIVSWGRRDGPNGTMAGLLHGSNLNFGAVANWGTPDMAWGPDAAAIANHVKTGTWTYVVYTYEGAPSNVGTVYSNGTLANTEALGLLNTWALDNTPAARPLPIRVAGQNAANGSLATAGQKGSLTLARLRIHDRVVPAAELGFNDSDTDGMMDWYEDFYGLNKAANDAGADPDSDGLSNLQEQTAGTNPKTADTDADGMPDGWEFANFGSQGALPNGDADNDFSTNLEEYQAAQGLFISRNQQGDVTSLTPFTGRSDPNNTNSQPDSEPDSLPDGWEKQYLSGLGSAASDDPDGDTFPNSAEFTAGSNPARRANTPTNVKVTTRVAVAVAGGLEEYTVTKGTWSFVRQICAVTGGVYGVTSHNGALYATTQEATPRIIRIDPVDGSIIELAVRNTGDAATAGWINSSPQGIEPGPDGKLYFSTAFGASSGEGVFRLNPDGSSFATFIPRTGGLAAEDWNLNNARDLEWDGSNLYVSARAGFNAPSRPVYQFTAAGDFVTAISNALVGPQGLEVEQDGLLVTSSAMGINGLVLLDLAAPFPTFPIPRSVAGITGGMDVMDLNGDTYQVNFNTGAGALGQVLRRNSNGSYNTVVAALSGTANDLAVFPATAAGGYNSWAVGFGLDPASVNGAPSGDADRDGTVNAVEFALGLDPTDGTSRFAIVTSGTAAAGLTLTWPSAAGVSFQVRSSTNLSDWSTIAATVIGQPSQTNATWTAPPAVGGVKFYRIQFTP